MCQHRRYAPPAGNQSRCAAGRYHLRAGSTASDSQTQQCKADGGPRTSAAVMRLRPGIVQLPVQKVCTSRRKSIQMRSLWLSPANIFDFREPGRPVERNHRVHCHNAQEQHPSRTGEVASRLHQQMPSYPIGLYASVHLGTSGALSETSFKYW